MKMPAPVYAMLAILLTTLTSPLRAQQPPSPHASATCSDALTPNVLPDPVIVSCTKIIRAHTTSAKQLAAAYVNRAIAYQNERRFDLAIADNTQAIAIDPKDDISFNNRAALFLLERNYDQAIADYSAVIAIDRDFIGAYWGRGNAYSAEHEYTNAIADYSQVIRIDPQGGIFGYGAYMGIGHAYLAVSDIKKAIANYTVAIGKVLTPTAFFLQRGVAYHQLNDIAHTELDYNEAVKRNPQLAIAGPYDPPITGHSPFELKYSLAFKVIGNGFLADGDNNSAIAAYNEAIHLNPQYAAALNNRGIALLNEQEYATALIQFFAAAKIDPQFALAYNNRANTFFKLGLIDDALGDYNTALSINPKLATALYPRAIIERANGNNDAAARDETAATLIDPQIANQFADFKIH